MERQINTEDNAFHCQILDAINFFSGIPAPLHTERVGGIRMVRFGNGNKAEPGSDETNFRHWKLTEREVSTQKQ